MKFENFTSLPASQRKMETQVDDSADKISESEGKIYKVLDLLTSVSLPWYSNCCNALPAKGELFLLKRMKSLRWA